MADHLDAPGLKSPGGAARVDITDIYLFQKPGDPGKSILIMNVNPLAPTLANSFMHDAIYEFKIDTDGDAIAERSFKVVFSEFRNGRQFASVVLDTRKILDRIQKGHMFLDNAPAILGDLENDFPEAFGRTVIRRAPVSFDATPRITEQGPYKFFAGLRSDPFFFDLMGFLNGFKFTGSDFFADKNVFGIVIEAPNSALGPNPKIGVWGRTLVHETGQRWFQIDRMARPAINTVFNHGDDKNTFNQIDPTQDRTTLTVDPNPKAGVTFLQSFELTLSSFGHSASEAESIATLLLPDILTFDSSSSAGFLNGRKLADDVIDIELNLITKGQVTTDKVGAHSDYLGAFPFLGTPH